MKIIMLHCPFSSLTRREKTNRLIFHRFCQSKPHACPSNIFLFRAGLIQCLNDSSNTFYFDVVNRKFLNTVIMHLLRTCVFVYLLSAYITVVELVKVLDLNTIHLKHVIMVNEPIWFSIFSLCLCVIFCFWKPLQYMSSAAVLLAPRESDFSVIYFVLNCGPVTIECWVI